MWLKRWAFIAGLNAIVAVGGCGQTATIPDRVHPEKTIWRYLAAVEKRDAEAAYQLLAPPVRGRFSPAAFRRFFRDNYALILAEARQLATAAKQGRLSTTVWVRLGRRRFLFAFEGGRWVFVHDPSVPSEPSDAIAGLKQLREDCFNGDLGRLQRWLGRGQRASLLRRLRLLGRAIDAALTSHSVTIGARRIQIGPKSDPYLVLTRQGGYYRIQRLRLPDEPR